MSGCRRKREHDAGWMALLRKYDLDGLADRLAAKGVWSSKDVFYMLESDVYHIQNGLDSGVKAISLAPMLFYPRKPSKVRDLGGQSLKNARIQNGAANIVGGPIGFIGAPENTRKFGSFMITK